MHRKKISYVIFIALLVVLVAGGFMYYRKLNYVAVTIDTSNVCAYDENGKMTSTTLAIDRIETIYVSKSSLNNYVQEAKASNRCVTY